jgi:hypothetical protein
VSGGIIFQALFYSAAIGLAIGSIAQCYRLSQISNQSCIRQGREVVMMVFAFNVITDFYVLILPIHRVLTLQLFFKHKLDLLLVFAGGLLYVLFPRSLKTTADRHGTGHAPPVSLP